MMKQVCLLLISLSAFVGDGYTQNNLSKEQELLSVFKGHWTVPGSEASYLEICNWIQGNHIQCISASKEKDRVDSSVSYLSFLPAEKVFVYYGLYPSGNSRTLRGKWVTDRFVFEGERKTTDKHTRWRVTITPVNKDLQFKEERSVNDGAWETTADFLYKRVL